MINKTNLFLVVMLMLSPAWGQTDTLKVKPKNDALDGCVPNYVRKYAVLCESAETVARGVAYACSPKPTPKGPSSGDQNSKYELVARFNQFARTWIL